MSDGRVPVHEYGDLASDPDLSPKEIDAIVRELNESGGPVLALEAWLTEDKAIIPMAGQERVYACAVTDESAKGWELEAGDRRDWVPKSRSTLFVLADEGGRIETPSTTLSEFGEVR